MRGAETLGIDEQGVVDVVSALAPGDFEKSMTSIVDSRNWQDVYKPTVRGRRLYVKFTLDAQGQFLLISFKENEP
jgi:motility quorum-sensing regulator/GCU-specific mRNA interferase toxin